jgi:predicted DNA-binding protein (MmcQ/YjbR family)
VITVQAFRKLALSFEGAEEKPHFEKTSFRIRNKIFATMDTQKKRVVVKLSEVDQSVFSQYNPSVIYPVRAGWGRQGWTVIELKGVRKEMLIDAVTTVAPKKLVEKYRPESDPKSNKT